jgi:purine-nucleoside phosphorylase
LFKCRRRGRSEDIAAIHHAVIACTDQLMKVATTKEPTARGKGVMCADMEAAGLLEQAEYFSCFGLRSEMLLDVLFSLEEGS